MPPEGALSPLTARRVHASPCVSLLVTLVHAQTQSSPSMCHAQGRTVHQIHRDRCAESRRPDLQTGRNQTLPWRSQFIGDKCFTMTQTRSAGTRICKVCSSCKGRSWLLSSHLIWYLSQIFQFLAKYCYRWLYQNKARWVLWSSFS